MQPKRLFTWSKSLLWAVLMFETWISTMASNVTTVMPQITDKPVISEYAWSSWGRWSPCSRSCGGGVAVQERQCLPRSEAVMSNNTLLRPVITVRLTRRIRSVDCVGVSRRYHQCNTAPCAGVERDTRAVQCAAYDRRPFRGRFYTWIPYIDGDSPCTLNCRPLGQHFYASLGLVADGTPCTKPGFQAICVQGTCKVIGRESVLAAANTREVRCGRRLVSGLFSRPKLPLGYSYVTTVPRGACRLNVSEIGGSENYIALKISNGSYIMNGEFAVSAPGTYDAAGARFLYTRQFGQDVVFALGPIQQPIDIMILYTQPNPSIKYEYFTESVPGEVDIESVTRLNIPQVTPAITKHSHRYNPYDIHPFTASAPRYPDLSSMSKENNSEEDDFEENVVGTRRFIWKILSYTQCTRSCGGGIQVGKYRCVEIGTNASEREVSPVHCLGASPAGRRRRCGHTPCPPRWRAAAWTQCPKCGPATRTRIVGCVQDHSRGITKISDQKCPSLKPATSETCNIPNCNELSPDIKHVEKKRVITPREHTDHFRDGPVYTISINNSDNNFGSDDSFSVAADWVYTDWSECVGWCVGGGVQTRGVRCADPSGCTPRKSPDTSKTCTPKMTCDPHDGQWFTGQWSACSSRCGGKQVRGVLCIGGGGRRLREAACRAPRPDAERDCATQCSPAWYYSDWGKCTGNCTTGGITGVGVARRTVWCASASEASSGALGGASSGASSDAACATLRPLDERSCALTCTASNIPPDLTIESQRTERSDNISSQEVTTKESVSEDCKDKLSNCALAVRARLCHYGYYMRYCCNSCKGR